MYFRQFIVFLFLLLFFLEVKAQKKPDFLVDYNNSWVDSVFNTLTLDQKVGQLLMPRGNYSGRPHDIEKLKSWVKDYKIGGIVFFASQPTIQAQITNELQALSSVPLLIGQDFEWGLGMRLDSTDRFPYGVSLGAIQGQEHLLEAMGAEIGRQCRRIGVHVNYAPVVDVNNNPDNPVINFRSFGSDKLAVTQKSLAYMRGMQKQNILCTAKHFPGHGDTDTDSHYDLPVIKHDRQRLEDVELYPFKNLIDEGLSGIMSAHLNIPALEPKQGLASTFSTQILYKLLREEMGFEGLLFTDAMEMKGAIKNFPKGESMVRALLAGNDILETFMDVPEAVEAIKKAILKGVLPMKIIDFKVKKILKAKSWVGLGHYKPIDLKNLVKDLNTIESDVINRQLTEASVTCLKNDLGHLPIKDLTQNIAVLTIDAENPQTLVSMVQNYTKVDVFHIHPNISQEETTKMLQQLENYDLVVTSIHWSKPRASSNYGITPENKAVISQLINRDNIVFVLLGNPYALHKMAELQNAKTLVVTYQCNTYTESIVPQILLGALPSRGAFPIHLNEEFCIGKSHSWEAIGRLSYGVPEQVGMDRTRLLKGMDSIINVGLNKRAYPGGVLQIAKDGKVVFQKGFGFHTYDVQYMDIVTENPEKKYRFIDDAMDNPLKITNTFSLITPNPIPGKVYTDHIYDLASLTKVLAATFVGLKWIDEGHMTLGSKLSDFIPEWKDSNKENIIFLDAVTHRSGLKAWIPFWKNAIDTTTTLKKALELTPSLKNEMLYNISKPNFFRRLFGAKPQSVLDMPRTLSEKRGLWEKILTPQTIAWKPNTFSHNKTENFNVNVAKNLWIHKDYMDSIYYQIKASSMTARGQYVYSDLHYYLYPKLSQKLVGKPLDQYLYDLYSKIGANSLRFNPHMDGDTTKIVPTEYDSLFRNQLLHGYVHDEGASMLGGVSGHAGLFGNANDVMKIMQMYLQKGYYGGEQYISSKLIEKATQYQFPNEKNRRGLGFDKKDFNKTIINAPSLASEASYGHSGFTGTYTWVDPEHNLVYVFLSNRVYPSRNNRTIIDENIRSKIGDFIISTLSKK